MLHGVDVLTSFLASTTRLGTGLNVTGAVAQPEKRLELYEFEACPYCRKVRDALTVLDLDAMIYPCPKGGERYRKIVEDRGGMTMFPYLVDPNTGVEMYESDDIVRYLFETYAGRPPTALYRLSPLNTASSMVASALRPMRGLRKRPARAPEQPLELWSFEESPFCRIVRERLTELEIAYVLHNVGKGSARESIPPAIRARVGGEPTPSTENRRAFVARSGKMQVPYLADPNTGVEMFESADIVAYLDATYARCPL